MILQRTVPNITYDKSNTNDLVVGLTDKWSRALSLLANILHSLVKAISSWRKMRQKKGLYVEYMHLSLLGKKNLLQVIKSCIHIEKMICKLE